MHPRTFALTAAITGTLLADAALAQNTAGGTPAQTTAPGAAGETPACPPGCVRATTASRIDAERARSERRRTRARRARARRAENAPAVPQAEVAPSPAEPPTALPPPPETRVEAPAPAPPVATAPARPAMRPRGGGPVEFERPTVFTPIWSVALESGVGAFGAGVGDTSTLGPMYGVRMGMGVLPFLTVEGRYVGGYNRTHENRGAGLGAGLLTNGVSATVRVSFPRPRIQPYVFGGFGVYHTAVTGADRQRQGVTLESTFAAVVPVGIGLELPINFEWSLGIEGTYHAMFRERFASDPAYQSGELWTGSGMARYTF
jgi:hypothetical protein